MSYQEIVKSARTPPLGAPPPPPPPPSGWPKAIEAEPTLPPTVRILVNYAATDGSMPDSVEITWETAFPAVAHIQEIVRMLATLGRISSVASSSDTPGETT